MLRNVQVGDSGTLSFLGARVSGISGDLVTFDVGHFSRPEQFTVPMATPAVEFVTEYPQHWPPQPGSVWVSRDRAQRFHALLYHPDPDNATEMEGTDENGARVILVRRLRHSELGCATAKYYRPEQVHRIHGPLAQLLAPEPKEEA